MQENPRAPADGLVSPDVRSFLYLSSFVIVLALCGLLLFLRAMGADQATILTVGYLFIGMLGMGFVFVTRSFRASFFTNMLAKTPLWIGVFFGVCFLIFPFITPSIRSFFGIVSLSVPMVGIVLGAVLLSLIPLDIAKRRLVHRSAASNLLS
jgi:magnesium-transporting ATPase (P-type)